MSIPGVYGGWLDKFPLGAAFAKGLTLKMGQTHMHRYLPTLLHRIERGEIDPSFVITHRVTLDDAPEMYQTFREKQDDCIKVVMKPPGDPAMPPKPLRIPFATPSSASDTSPRSPSCRRSRTPPRTRC